MCVVVSLPPLILWHYFHRLLPVFLLKADGKLISKNFATTDQPLVPDSKDQHTGESEERREDGAVHIRSCDEIRRESNTGTVPW
jgi:hypothetical protein